MNQGTTVNLTGNWQRKISILAVVAAEHSAETLRMLSHTRWELHLVHSIREAKESLASFPVSIVLCDDRLKDGGWLDLVKEIKQLCPSTQTIVLSDSTDSSLWAEAISHGVYELLARPIDCRELCEVIPMAWRHWRNQADEISSPDNAPRMIAMAHGG
jgi:DNA-binding NtrC family response regulator